MFAVASRQSFKQAVVLLLFLLVHIEVFLFMDSVFGAVLVQQRDVAQLSAGPVNTAVTEMYLSSHEYFCAVFRFL